MATGAEASREESERFPDIDEIDLDDAECLAHDEAIEQLFPHDGAVPPRWWAAVDRDGARPPF
jgi:hypothetical protein